MKPWALAVLLMAAVLAEKALARPNEQDDDDGFQDDEANESGAQKDQTPSLQPVLRTVSLHLTPKPGDTVLLPCHVENVETVVWLNNTATVAIGDRRLTYKDDKRISIHKNHTFEIRDVQPSDSGNYICRIHQGLEVVHHLNVYQPPRLEAVEPSDKQISLERGEHLTLRCNVTGFPEPTIVWNRRGKDLPGGHSTHQGAHLHFAHVTVTHIGTYVCTATNPLGKVQHSFNVLVTDVPDIDLEREMTNTDIGQTAELTCNVHAHPPAVVEWYFGDKLLSPSERVEMRKDFTSKSLEVGDRHVLRVVDVGEADLGSYYCLAKNDQGTARRAVRLSGIPSAARLDEVQQNKKGGPILFWTVESYAPIKKYELMYRRKEPVTDWTVIELPVVPSEGNIFKVQYELKNVEAAEYETKLKSQNSFGWSDLSPKYPFTADSFNRAVPIKVGESGSGAPVERICSGLLLGAVILLLSRSQI